MSESALLDPKAESASALAGSFEPLHWRRALLLALVGIACFHAAYTPAKSGLLAVGVIGYLVCVVVTGAFAAWVSVQQFKLRMKFV